jgi:asparagine synthase (glutamine-hydrolysing)
MSMEGIDAASTTVPLEFRHPFADLRVVDFLLAIPAVPWCVDKKLLRSATKHQLPDLVRLRSKSPARGSPLLAKLGRTEESWIDRIAIHPALERYVVPDALPRVTGAVATATVGIDIRPVCLNVWLQQQSLNRVHGANTYV